MEINSMNAENCFCNPKQFKNSVFMRIMILKCLVMVISESMKGCLGRESLGVVRFSHWKPREPRKPRDENLKQPLSQDEQKSTSSRVFGKGVSKKEFQKRSFTWYVPCVPRYVPFASETEEEHPKELGDETPFPIALSVRKRSVTKGVRTGYLAHVPRYLAFLLADLKRDTPRNFDMKRLIRNAFSELGCTRRGSYSAKGRASAF